MSRIGRSGEQIETLYQKSGPSVLGYFARRVADKEEAADLFSEVMVVVWRRRLDLPPAGEDRLWLFGVARNVLAAHQRQAVRHRQVNERLAEALRTAVPSALDHDGAIDLRAAVRALDPLDKEIVLLSSWEGLTSTEIGVLLAMPAETVRSRLKRARARLRRDLALADPDDHQRAVTAPTPQAGVLHRLRLPATDTL